MLQFHWYLRVGSDPRHFANFANDVSQNVPRTTKTELDAGFHSTRSRERKRAQISSQNASKIVPESFKITPQNSQRAPEELHGPPPLCPSGPRGGEPSTPHYKRFKSSRRVEAPYVRGPVAGRFWGEGRWPNFLRGPIMWQGRVRGEEGESEGRKEGEATE